MLTRLRSWLTTDPPPAVLVLTFFAFMAGMVTCASCATQPGRATTIETDLCRARAAWKVVALAAGGALDPKPGSARAKLEAAEDALCALVPVPSSPPESDAGP